MVTINAPDLQAKCLAILDQVADTGESVVILKRGRPIAQLVPPTLSDEPYPQLSLVGSVEIHGDLVTPVTS